MLWGSIVRELFRGATVSGLGGKRLFEGCRTPRSRLETHKTNRIHDGVPQCCCCHRRTRWETGSQEGAGRVLLACNCMSHTMSRVCGVSGQLRASRCDCCRPERCSSPWLSQPHGAHVRLLVLFAVCQVPVHRSCSGCGAGETQRNRTFTLTLTLGLSFGRCAAAALP